MKGILHFFSIMIFALLLGIVVGNAGGYAIIYVDEFEGDRTIK